MTADPLVLDFLSEAEMTRRSLGDHDSADMLRQFSRALQTGQLQPQPARWRSLFSLEDAAADHEANARARMFAGANGQVSP